MHHADEANLLELLCHPSHTADDSTVVKRSLTFVRPDGQTQRLKLEATNIEPTHSEGSSGKAVRPGSAVFTHAVGGVVRAVLAGPRRRRRWTAVLEAGLCAIQQHEHHEQCSPDPALHCSDVVIV